MWSAGWISFKRCVMVKKENWEIYGGLALAPLYKRVLAFMIDLFVINIFISPFKTAIERVAPGISSGAAFSLNLSESQVSSLQTIMLFAGLTVLLYFSVMEWKFGETIGKHLLGIRVASLFPSEKHPVPYFNFLVRSLFIIPVFPFILLWVIDPLYMMWNPYNQRLSEYLSKTVVLEGGGLFAKS